MHTKPPGMPEDSQYGMSSPLAREVARVFGFRAHSKEVGGPVTRWEADGGKDVTKKMAHLMSIIEAGEIAIGKMSTTAPELHRLGKKGLCLECGKYPQGTTTCKELRWWNEMTRLQTELDEIHGAFGVLARLMPKHTHSGKDIY